MKDLRHIFKYALPCLLTAALLLSAWTVCAFADEEYIPDEYYENMKYESRYFFGRIVGKTKTNLTDREKEVGMVPRFLPVTEIMDIFAQHDSYAQTDEMRRGMYLREYTALHELLGNHLLYLRQRKLLDQFLATGAISQAQHDKSLYDLTEKMGETEFVERFI